MCLGAKFTALPESVSQMVLICEPDCVAPGLEATLPSPHSLNSQGLKAVGFLACISNCPSSFQLAAPDCGVASA